MTSWPGYPPPTPPKPSWYRNLMVWVWVYVGLTMAGAVAVGLFMFVDVFFAYGWEEDDDFYYVEQGSVNQAVAQPCREMAEAGQDIRVFSPPEQAAGALRRFVTAGRRVPAAIDAVEDADSSARQWGSDWTVVLDAIDSFADDLESDATAEFEPPVSDGISVMLNMSYVSDQPCELPPAVIALDPEASDTF